MTDAARPARPEYGEYATPAQVAEAMGLDAPHPDAPPAVVPERTPVSEPAPAPASTSVAPETLPAPAAADRVEGRRPVPAWDRPVTVTLLTLGVLNLLFYIPAYLSFAETLTTALDSTPYSSVTIGSDADVAGIALLVVQVVVLLAAVAVSVRMLRHGRRAFWIPIVGAVLSLTAYVITVAIVALPAMLNS